MYNLDNIKWKLIEESDEVNKIYETVIQYEEFIKWSEKQKINGFRPGTVPLNEEIQHKFLNDIVSFIFPKLNIKNVFSVNYVLKNFEKDKPIEISMTVESMPKIPNIDFTKYKVTKYKLKIEKEDIDKAIENFAIIEAKEDINSCNGPAKISDFLKIEIKDLGTNQIQQKDIQLGKFSLNPEIEKQLFDKNVGFVLEHVINDSLKFEIKIIDIKKGIKLTKTEIAEKLKINESEIENKFKEDSIEVAKNIEQKILNDTLFKIIVESNFTVPISCINKEFKINYSQTLNDLKYTDGMDLESLVKAKLNISIDEFEQRLQNSAIFSGKLKFFLDYYAFQNKIQASEEDIANLIQARSMYFKNGLKEAQKFFTNNADAKKKLIDDFIHPKVISKLTALLKIKEEKILSFEELQKINIQDIQYENLSIDTNTKTEETIQDKDNKPNV